MGLLTPYLGQIAGFGAVSLIALASFFGIMSYQRGLQIEALKAQVSEKSLVIATQVKTLNEYKAKENEFLLKQENNNAKTIVLLKNNSAELQTITTQQLSSGCEDAAQDAIRRINIIIPKGWQQ